jgi:hypothetical protein
MEIGYPVTSCEENRQESFRRHVPTTYRTFYEGQPTALGAREVGIARLALAVTLDTWDASLSGKKPNPRRGASSETSRLCPKGCRNDTASQRNACAYFQTPVSLCEAEITLKI